MQKAETSVPAFYLAKARKDFALAIKKKIKTPEIHDFRCFLAENEGFEPSRRFRALLP